MHLTGSNGGGVSLEFALREFVRAIVREEMGKDWPKVDEAEKEPEAVEEPEATEEPEEDTTATLEDSEDDSPEIDAVPTMEDAVARAKEVMTEDGGKARLKTALSAVGATRVSAIPEDKITEFMEALDD
jgi:hypothetical protein